MASELANLIRSAIRDLLIKKFNTVTAAANAYGLDLMLLKRQIGNYTSYLETTRGACPDAILLRGILKDDTNK